MGLKAWPSSSPEPAPTQAPSQGWWCLSHRNQILLRKRWALGNSIPVPGLFVMSSSLQ